MSVISSVRFPSAALGKTVTFTVLVPELNETDLGPFPSLYLLAPHGGGHDDWLIKTRLERYLAPLPLLVVLPSLENTLGCATATGYDYERFFFDELMAYVESIYPVKRGPETTAIAGAGAGGYAALRLAFAFPYWFGVAASLSAEIGANREEKVLATADGSTRAPLYRQVFGDPNDPRRDAHDLITLAEQLGENSPLQLLLECGVQDEFIGQHREFHRRLSTLRLSHQHNEQPGGHDWDYWDSRLPEALKFVARSVGLPSKK